MNKPYKITLLLLFTLVLWKCSPLYGQFTLHQSWATDYSPLEAVADLDGDGNQDLICRDYWMQKNEDGSYEIAQWFPPSYDFTSIQPVDFDGDGDIDMLAELSTPGLYLLRNEDAYFELEWLDIPKPRRYVDFDSDGDIDLLIKSDDAYHWLINDHGLSNALTVEIAPAQQGTTESLCQLNDDEKLDLCICSTERCQFYAFLDGSYQPAAELVMEKCM